MSDITAHLGDAPGFGASYCTFALLCLGYLVGRLALAKPSITR
jgi:hypothetical protein